MATFAHPNRLHGTPQTRPFVRHKGRFTFYDAPSSLNTLGQRVVKLLAAIEDARTLAQRYENLSALSDAQLNQHGLSRKDVARVVFNSQPRS